MCRAMRGDHCLPEMACPASEPDTGQVVFHLRDGAGRYINDLRAQ